jgi:hypothetical protein
MLLKLILLVPSVLSIALCAYLLVGLSLYFRALYRTVPAVKFARTRHAHGVASASSSAATVEIEALPAT